MKKSTPSKEELLKRIAFLEETLDKRTHELTAEISDYVLIRSDLDRRTRELNQRLKELNCMVQISRLSDRTGIPLRAYIQETLQIIISSFQHSGIASAQLKLGDEIYQTPGFNLTEWKIGRGLMDQDNMIGYLIVCYSENRSDGDSGPFTYEEKNFMIVLTRFLVQILKRKEYEDQLQVFLEALEQSPNIIYITDRLDRIEFLNEQAEKVFGHSLAELKGQVFYLPAVESPDHSIRENIRSAMLEGTVFKGETEVLDKEGKPFRAKVRISPIFKDFQVISYVTELEDITEETELRRINREQEEKFRAVVENNPISISLIDKNGYFVYVNPHALVDLEIPAEKILNKNITEVFKKEEAGKTMKDIEDIFLHKKRTFQETSYEIHGQVKYFEITRQPVFDRDGNVALVMSLVNNITHRREADELIRFQHTIDSLHSLADTFEGSLQLLFDNLFNLHWIDAGGLYVFNKERTRLDLVYHRGLSEEYLKNVLSYGLDSQNARIVLEKVPRYASVKKYLDVPTEAVNQEQISFVCVMPLVFQDQVIGCLNLASRIVTDLSTFERMAIESISGRVANVVALAQAQDTLKKTNEELAATLKSLQENRQMLIQKSRLESLGELSAGLAHEINQPLSIISLAIENLEIKMQNGQADQEYLVKKFNNITNNISKIRQLIDHVRLFSRDQKENILQRCDVHKVIQEALTLIHEQLRSHRITVTLKEGNGIGFVIGNPSRLEQVFLNLLSNARDALDEMERHSSSPGMKKEIRITTRSVEDEVEIEFHDNGTGISKANQERIFDPFFTTKPEGQGTGLGLPIVYGIIREMKGSVTARSAPGKYTKIILRIPSHKLKGEKP